MLQAAELQGLPKESVSLVWHSAHLVALLTSTCTTLVVVGLQGEINEVHTKEDILISNYVEFSTFLML